MKQSRRKSLKKRLAAAVSVVNLLNAAAPIALPYVNIMKDGDGAVPGALVNVAEARHKEEHHSGTTGMCYVHDDELHTIEYLQNMDNSYQIVYSGGSGVITKMDRGRQEIQSRGLGTVSTMNGGSQFIAPYASACIENMKGGTQILQEEIYGGLYALGTITNMDGGTQIVSKGGSGSVKTMNGGTQIVLGKADYKNHRDLPGGTIETMNGGTQLISSGGRGTVSTMNGGTQFVSSGGTGTVTSLKGGSQVISAGGLGLKTSAFGGTQIVEAGGVADGSDVYAGGLLIAKSGGTVTDYTRINAGGVLEERSGASVPNPRNINQGGTHRIVDITRDKIDVAGYTLEVTSGSTATKTQVQSGGTELVTMQGKSEFSTIINGGTQIVSGGTAVGAHVGEYGDVQIVSGGTAITRMLNAGGVQIVRAGTGIVETLGMDQNDSESMQQVFGGVAVVRHLNNGTQEIYSGGGTVVTMDGGTQTIRDYGCSGFVQTLNGGTQNIRDGAKGYTGVLNSGGTQEIHSGGTGTVGTFAGGTLWMAQSGFFAKNLTGYGTVGQLNMGGTATATGGEITGNSASVGVLSVAEGGSVTLTNDLNASLISLGTTPTSMNPLVSAGGNITVNTVDFTGLRSKKRVAEYNFLSAGGAISDLTVARNGKTAALKAGDIIERPFVHETVSPKTGLTLGYDTAHTVYLSKDRHTLGYKIQNVYTDAAFIGTIPWSATTPYYDVSEYYFGANPTVDLAKLGFSFTYDTATALAPNQSMTLLSGLPNTTTISTAAPASFPVSFSGTNTILSATATGSASVSGDTVKYTVNGVTLDKVNVRGINGAADKVPTNWTKNAADVAVDTDTVELAPDSLLGSYTLLTADSAFFSDDKITGTYKYQDKADFNHTRNGVTLGGTWSRGVRSADGGRSLVFVSGELKGNDISLGNMTWNKPRALTGALNCDFTGTTVDATDLSFSGLGTDLAPGSTSDLLTGAKNLAAGTAVTGANHRQYFSANAENGVTLSATLAGTVSVATDTVRYTANSITLNRAALAGWNGETAKVPEGWLKNNSGVIVNTDNMSPHPEKLARRITTILTGPAGFFSDATLTGANLYAVDRPFSSTRNGVTLGGTWSRGVDVGSGGARLIFRAGDANVNSVAVGLIPWWDGGVLRPNAWLDAIHYDNVDAVDTTHFSIANPADAGAGEIMMLLKANSTLKDMAAETKTAHYAYQPVSGVTVTGGLTGQLEAKAGALTFKATENRASNIAFRGVNWTGETPLTACPEKITCNGATVNTSKIAFMNVSNLKVGDVTTLLTNYDGKPGAIVGDKYRIGTAFEGDGKASMVWDDLIFTVESAPEAAEQTHNALMGAGAGMVALSSGNDFIEGAAGGLGQASNIGSDGVAVYAQMGGGSTRQETGSHIDVHSWNAILALGHKNEKEKSAFEYGAFFEYGTGNYTTHNGDLRGDGSVRYTGGGLLAKWTAKHGFYVEGSLRGGSIHGKTNGVLRDVNDNPYSYESDVPYWGLHLGVGRELDLGHGNTLDVYGKYFMNRRKGTTFDAEDHYDLNALTSHILRVGVRCTMKRDKWSYYGGLAYEHELDGKASGTVSNGVLSAPIRGTDPTGGSLRMELGATVKPGENSPWNIDFNVTGFAGKKQGVSGGVSVAFMF